MWVKEYRSNKDIDVEFEDGYISHNKKYTDFKKGKIQNKNFKRAYTVESPIFNDRTGEENYNKQNLKMWIEKYRGSKDIDIRFEDGYLAKNKTYKDFKNGKIHNKNFKCVRPKGISHSMPIKDRTGEINYNSNGSEMTIIEYNNYHDIIVEFEGGYKTNSGYAQFKNGKISNPYDKTFYGKGYLGEGKFKTSINKEHTREYDRWKSMLSRCYNPKEKEFNKSYDNVLVCEEWLCFQNFAEWYNKNYYEIEGQRMQLDKDILIKGNKIYSPENCLIVPERINILFVKNKSKRGDYPIGVHYDKRNNCFVAGYNLFKESVRVGYYNDPIDAFYKGYKPAKEKLIKEVADQYKDKIPKKLYDAMISYEVEITD
jgi:hypothetical protein